MTVEYQKQVDEQGKVVDQGDVESPISLQHSPINAEEVGEVDPDPAGFSVIFRIKRIQRSITYVRVPSDSSPPPGISPAWMAPRQALSPRRTASRRVGTEGVST